MNEIVDKLQELSEAVPVPLELPDFEQLVDVEEQILLPLPADLKEYLLNASDVIYGSIEPVTAADPCSHTYLPEVAAYAWSIGLPRDLIPICQIGDDFYCMDPNGQIDFWQNDNFADEPYESFWQWAEAVWLQS